MECFLVGLRRELNNSDGNRLVNGRNWRKWVSLRTDYRLNVRKRWCMSDCKCMRCQLYLAIVIFLMEFFSLSISLCCGLSEGSHQQALLVKYMNEHQMNQSEGCQPQNIGVVV